MVWQPGDLAAEFAARLATQTSARQVVVDHYRVGHRWAFALPVAERPSQLPADVGSLHRYPWLIWLSWQLRERWDVFAAAWAAGHDDRAGLLLQDELAALDGWQHFRNWRDEVGLPTGHLALGLARGLALPGWDPAKREAAERAGRRLVEQDVPDWFATTWQDEGSLHNIPIIVLCSVAALADQLGHGDAQRYRERAVAVMEAWFTARAEEHHTEQTAYNGYLFDTVTGWLELDRQRGGDLVGRWRSSLLGLCEEWAQLTVPGRTDLAMPLGDVESEMTMWLSCVTRLSDWYGPAATAGAAWLVRHCPPARLPAEALQRCLAGAVDGADEPPPTGARELPTAVAVRHGWTSDDPAVAVGVARSPMGHLHCDAGQVILAWRGHCWVTDPGYQQYRRGVERDYTLGVAAHNAPVINGRAQTVKQSVLVSADPVVIDLTPAYEGLAGDGATLSIRRQVAIGADRLVVIDEVTGIDGEVATHWLADAWLAWACVDGWVRWSDGTAALWCGTGSGLGSDQRDPIPPDGVERHEGSRGPVGLRYVSAPGVRHWQFVWDAAGGWQPPSW